jgi:hypothetical protein
MGGALDMSPLAANPTAKEVLMTPPPKRKAA